MPRFLSSEWFDAIRLHSGRLHSGQDEPPKPNTIDSPGHDRLVLEQLVTGSPDGDVRYWVIVENGNARLAEPASPNQAADLTITTGWDTATAIAKGELATQAALMQGKLRVRGNMSKLAGRAGQLTGLDPVPEAVRKATTY
jgi:SCP-2 sterol transfer family